MLTHMIARLLTTDLTAPDDCAAPPATAQEPGFDPSDLPLQMLTHRSGIIDILNAMTAAGQPVRLMAPGISRPDLTRVMSFDGETGELLVRQLIDEDRHASVMQSRYVNISTLYEGTPLLFSMHVAGTRLLDAVPCYMLRQPTWMMRIQMRGFVRVRLPKHASAKLHWAPACQPPLDAQVLDLSESGMGFMCPPQDPSQLQVGSTLKLVDFLAKDVELLALHLVIKRVSTTSSGEVLVGASIHTSNESQRRVLRQYILLHQRNQSVAE